MKITFLGTSHGVPSATRYCSSTMIEVGDSVYLIDGGAPVGSLLLRCGIDYAQVKAVFTTHGHADHTLGILHLIHLAEWYFTKSRFDVYLPTQRHIDVFHRAIEVTDHKLNERTPLKLTEPGCFYEDENIKVTAIPTRHMEAANEPSYALIIEAEGKRVVFTGDLHYPDAADFPQLAKDEPSDLIICEMAHFGHETIIPIVGECPAKRVFFNHVFWNYDESMAAIREADGRYPMPISAVEDGDVYEL